ncbi:hypothetical protein PMI01_05313 [Caulobacter sp. AP07]|jgi:hypothetical protein|uniref:hypothetical protein n=1 Tax=Caulobacter sp. AP07 TaxID=1144304 RepID=UPI000271DA90|nr:hypothetical protein [Caulobacter sp. AP07]EJL21060.1 hypothetical protein PMI01_05313 [Caulobacter sp. AP07]
MIVRRPVYFVGSLCLIILAGFLAGLVFFLLLPKGAAVAATGLLILSAASFAGAVLCLARALGG